MYCLEGEGTTTVEAMTTAASMTPRRTIFVVALVPININSSKREQRVATESAAVGKYQSTKKIRSGISESGGNATVARMTPREARAWAAW